MLTRAVRVAAMQNECDVALAILAGSTDFTLNRCGYHWHAAASSNAVASARSVLLRRTYART